MKPNRNNKQDCLKSCLQKIFEWPVGNFGVLLLLPAIFYQYQAQLLLWILLGIAGGIMILFVLIAFILLPLSRRAKRHAQKQNAAEVDTLPAPVEAEVEAEPPQRQVETEPSMPKVVDVEAKDTVMSMPTVTTVGTPSTVPASGSRPAGIGWQISALTDVGLQRQLNEDNMIMLEGEMDGLGPYGIYVVADGLGGHEAGEVASRLTVDAVQKRHALNPPLAGDAPFEEWLKDTIMMANSMVLEQQTGSDGEARKMGSTLVMALVAGQNAHIINVGDSRAYRLNSEEIEQLTVDHSLVERLVQIGQITREEARTHKQRNVIYSIIGEKRKLEIGFYHAALKPGDRLLLCSDGLSGMVTDEELLHISKHQPDPVKANQLMIEAAKNAGGNDNITVILIQMNGG